jgi:hypothetical protein
MKYLGLKIAMRMLPIAAGLVLAGSRLYAQDGPCCSETETVVRSCNNGACKGTVTFRGCANPTGENAVHYKVFVVHCCNEDEGTAFNVQSGGLCSGEVTTATNGFSIRSRSMFQTAANSVVDEFHHSEGVWVRTCAHKYVFVVLPKPS